MNSRSVALLDPGSVAARDAVSGGAARDAGAAGPSGRRLPAWAARLATQGLNLPHLESNAVLVDAQRSGTGQALAVMGPQVGYYTPEVFLEYEMHAPGIDVSGVSFPGASPYPLIGHGIDFAWTGTSAFSANEDVFAERLCNPNRSRPSFASTHYLYRGTLHRVQLAHDRRADTGRADAPERAADDHPAHARLGPRPGRQLCARPRGAGGAGHRRGHARARGPELRRVHAPGRERAYLAAELRRRDARRIPGARTGSTSITSNIAVLQSGWFPRHARGTDPDLPIWGTGKWDWRGFQPSSNGYSRLPASANPTTINPKQGYLVNWNNAIAHGWRVAAGDWSNGAGGARDDPPRPAVGCPAPRARLDLAGLTGAVTAPSLTADLRGMAVWPWLRRVIGRSRNGQVRQLVALLNGWAAGGSQRRAAGGSNVVADSPAVLLMDTWWPLLVRAEFQPAVGKPLMDLINQQFNSIQPDGIRDETGNGFFEGWEMDVQQDLRQVLHQRVAGRFSRTYCGGGKLKRCRALVVRTLLQAAAQLRARYGSSMTKWVLPVTCAVTSPPSCDQIIPTAAGAINIPPQPFDNRGTFYQAVAVTGHR